MPACSKCEFELIRTKSGNCKQCQKIWMRENKDRVNKSKDKFYKQNPEYNRAYKLKSRYGLTLEAFTELLKSQNYKCAICDSNTTKRKKDTWIVDHCHKTGKVRGILCHKCNIAIAFLEDDPELMDKAKEYLNCR